MIFLSTWFLTFLIISTKYQYTTKKLADVIVFSCCKIHFGIVWSHSLGKPTSLFKSLFNVIWLVWSDSKTRLLFSSFILLEERGIYAGMAEKKLRNEDKWGWKQLHYKKLPFLFVTEPYLRLLLAAAGRLQCWVNGETKSGIFYLPPFLLAWIINK